MSASHHDREEETLIAYFQQMLAEVDDQEFDGEIQSSTGGLKAAPGAESSYTEESNHAVLDSANAAIAASHEQHEAHGAEETITNPLGGMERISTQDMLSQEMSMADDIADIDNHLTGFEASYAQDRAAAEAMMPELKGQEKAQTESRDFAQPETSHSLQRLLASIDTSADHAVQAQAELAVKIATATTPVVKTEVKTETAVSEVVPEVKVAEAVAEAAPAPVAVAPAPAPAVAEVEAAPAPVVAAPAVAVAPVAAPVKKAEKQVVKTPQQLAQERMAAKLRSISSEWKNVDLGEQFQVLFFLVQGVRFAVPLIDLGGIFECDKITQLFGKPSWFMGITDVRGDKINIVDTLRWVMPEIGDSPDKYPYLISLGTSQWSIGCDVLEGNRTLSSSQVKWREIPGNRPWLAGIVTSDKCALLHVGALISLFEAGADIDDLNRDLEEKEKADKNKKKQK